MIDGEEYKLIKQAQKGHSDSFGILYDRYHQQIYRFVLLKTSHKQEAEDLTHEIFLSAWQNINRFSYQGHPFSSWLYQIARYRIIDYYRTKKENSTIDDLPEDRFEVNLALDNQLDQITNLKNIKSAIRQLNEDQQNVLILRFIEDLSPAEIAQTLNKSESAVRVTQHRAIQKLKEILKQ